MAGDWIKLHRSIADSGVWADDWLLKLWIWCLLRANYADRKWLGITIKRGQFVTARFSGAEELGVHPSKWYRGMQSLVELGNITTTPNNKNTIVTVVNYESYQGEDENQRTTSEQQMNNQRTTNEQQTNTREEGKKLISTGPGPSRRFAATDSSATIGNREALVAIRIKPLPRGTITNGQALSSLPTNIIDRPALAEWWRRHLSSDKPLTGDTMLDLLQVLCLATEAGRKGRAVKNHTAWFAKRLADGRWLESSTDAQANLDWLNSQIDGRKIEIERGAA